MASELAHRLESYHPQPITARMQKQLARHYHIKTPSISLPSKKLRFWVKHYRTACRLSLCQQSFCSILSQKHQLMVKLLNLITSLGSESQSAMTWPLLVELWHQVQSQLLADGVLLHRILATAYFMTARYSTASGSLSYNGSLSLSFCPTKLTRVKIKKNSNGDRGVVSIYFLKMVELIPMRTTAGRNALGIGCAALQAGSRSSLS